MSSTTAGSARPLTRRTAVVTGASRGIGLACARALVGAGARVTLLARSGDALDAIATELGDAASSVVVDLADADAVERAASDVSARLDGGPDILVNNAAVFLAAGLEDTSFQEFDRIVQVNLLAHFSLVRAFLPAMRRRGTGHVVTIGSSADRQVRPANAAYTASKFGARVLHESLRDELRGSGVRASLVSPDNVDTSLWDGVNPETRPAFSPRADMLAAADVADAVLFALTRPATVNVDELRLSRA